MVTRNQGHRAAAPARPRRGFTLIELLVALTLTVTALTITYMSFHAIAKAWQRGVAMSDRINHGDFVMEQLVAGLRSAYFPDASGGAPAYGFRLEDGGAGSSARDEISWVKIGGAMVGDEAPFANGPHRVHVSVGMSEEASPQSGLAVRAWRAYGEPDDFRFEDQPREFLATRVVGFTCRVATNMINGRVDWLDTWEDTNRLPAAVEVTLFLEPTEPGEPDVEIRRAVGIPVAPLAWRF